MREWCLHRNGGRIAKRNRGKTFGKRLQKIVNETFILVKVKAKPIYLTSTIIITLYKNSSDDIAPILSNTAGVLGRTGKNQS